MIGIEVLDHTADVRLRITADDLPALFAYGLLGMNSLLRQDFCQQNADLPLVRDIRIQAPDLTTLLIDFLSEVLTLAYIEKALFCEAEILHLDEGRLEAIVRGRPNDQLDEEIKAVSYHEAEVRRTSAGAWETTIIFDI